MFRCTSGDVTRPSIRWCYSPKHPVMLLTQTSGDVTHPNIRSCYSPKHPVMLLTQTSGDVTHPNIRWCLPRPAVHVCLCLLGKPCRPRPASTGSCRKPRTGTHRRRLTLELDTELNTTLLEIRQTYSTSTFRTKILQNLENKALRINMDAMQCQWSKRL